MYAQATDLLAKVVLWSIGMIVKTGCHHFFLRNAWKGFDIFCIPYMYTVSKLCLLHGLDKDQRINGKWKQCGKFWQILTNHFILTNYFILRNAWKWFNSLIHHIESYSTLSFHVTYQLDQKNWSTSWRMEVSNNSNFYQLWNS